MGVKVCSYDGSIDYLRYTICLFDDAPGYICFTIGTLLSHLGQDGRSIVIWW